MSRALPGKWWLNVVTGECIRCIRAHGDATAAEPGRFGIGPDEMHRLRDTYGNDGVLSWWEAARYAAQKGGWARIGGAHENGADEPPYIYAADIGHASKAAAWCIRHGIASSDLNIEITDPVTQVEGHGEFYGLRGLREINAFARSGALPKDRVPGP